MGFEFSSRIVELRDQLTAFMEEHVYPAEAPYFERAEEADDPFTTPSLMDELKARAREAGLWNWFLPKSYEEGPGLTNLEYAPH